MAEIYDISMTFSCVPFFNPMRRIMTMHCVFAFFNTTILALTVNLGAGFF